MVKVNGGRDVYIIIDNMTLLCEVNDGSPDMVRYCRRLHNSVLRLVPNCIMVLILYSQDAGFISVT